MCYIALCAHLCASSEMGLSHNISPPIPILPLPPLPLSFPPPTLTTSSYLPSFSVPLLPSPSFSHSLHPLPLTHTHLLHLPVPTQKAAMGMKTEMHCKLQTSHTPYASTKMLDGSLHPTRHRLMACTQWAGPDRMTAPM